MLGCERVRARKIHIYAEHKRKRRQKAKTEVSPRDRGEQLNLVPPAYLGEELKFAPGESSSPTGPSHPCLAAAPNFKPGAHYLQARDRENLYAYVGVKEKEKMKKVGVGS